LGAQCGRPKAVQLSPMSLGLALNTTMATVLSSHAPSTLAAHWEPLEELTENMAALRHVSDTCTWAAAPSAAWYDHWRTEEEFIPSWNALVLEFFSTMGAGEASMLRRSTYYNPPPLKRTPSSLCSTTDPLDNASAWRMARFGPFESHGGYDWHGVASADVLGIDALLAVHKAIWVTALAVTAIDQDGHVLGFPPIHFHHSHFGPYRSPGIGDGIGALSFPHGDTVCSAEKGGSACFLVSLPKGHGIPIDSRLMLNALLNDVRTTGAPPMQFSVEVAIRYTLVPVQPVGLFYDGMLPDFREGSLFDNSRGQQLFAQFLVPTAEESIMWTAVYPRYSGQLLNLWLHTHPLLGFEGAWLINAAPAQLGLHMFAASLGCGGTPFVPASHGLSSAGVKSMVLEHMATAALSFRCIWDGANYEFVDATFAEGVAPRAYDRQTRKQCFAGADRLEAGVAMTAIAFFGPQYCIGCRAADVAENHFHFQGYIIYDDDDTPDDLLQYSLSTPYDSHAMTSDYIKYCSTAALLAGSSRVCAWELPWCGGHEVDRYPRGRPAYVKTVRAVLAILFDLMRPGWSMYAESVSIALVAVVILCCVCACGPRQKQSAGNKRLI